jgi:hypothetical protein
VKPILTQIKHVTNQDLEVLVARLNGLDDAIRHIATAFDKEHPQPGATR